MSLYPACIAATLLLNFVLACGINYNRHTFLHGEDWQHLSFERTLEEERMVFDLMLADFNAVFDNLENQITTDADGVFMLTRDLSLTAPAAMRNLATQFPRLDVHFPQPKPVRLLADFMSDAFIIGFYFPLTMEANYNSIAVDSDRAISALHELAHVAGFMREDEANFIAFLAGRESGDPELVYAAYLFVFSALLRNESFADTAAEMRGALPEQIQRDLQAQFEFWWGRRFSITEDGEVVENPVAGAIGDASVAANDAFLRSQGQEGVASYGRMVDLIFATELARIRGE
jgi:hypothetical protein